MNPITKDFIDIKNHLAAYHLLVAGEFTAEIARLEELNEALQKKLGFIKIIDDAKALAGTITTQTNNILADTEARGMKLTEALRAVSLRERDADLKANTARELELDTQANWTALGKAQDAHEAYITKTTAALDASQIAVNASAAAVAAQQDVLNAKVVEINAALKSANALTSV